MKPNAIAFHTRYVSVLILSVRTNTNSGMSFTDWIHAIFACMSDVHFVVNKVLNASSFVCLQLYIFINVLERPYMTRIINEIFCSFLCVFLSLSLSHQVFRFSKEKAKSTLGEQ